MPGAPQVTRPGVVLAVALLASMLAAATESGSSIQMALERLIRDLPSMDRHSRKLLDRFL